MKHHKNPPSVRKKATMFLGRELLSITGMMSLAPREYLVKKLAPFRASQHVGRPTQHGKKHPLLRPSQAMRHMVIRSGDGRLRKPPRSMSQRKTPTALSSEAPQFYGICETMDCPFNVYPHSVDLTDAQEMDVFGKALGDYMKGHRRRTALFWSSTRSTCALVTVTKTHLGIWAEPLATPSGLPATRMSM